MISNNLFYQHYQANFFNLKQSWLGYLLENHESIELKSGHLSNIEDKEILISIKTDIRQTYFQAIETVFEILFGLGPNDKGEFPQNILKNISSGKLNYNRINSISKDANELNYLNQELIINGNRKVSLGEYIFYFGIDGTNRYGDDLTNSIIAIKHALFILSQDFSDRSEYNSYKHGLRVMRALRNFSILNSETQKEEMNFSLSDSMTYYSNDKKKNESSFVTKLFDTERDLRMISICSNIIHTMIRNRDFYLNNKETENKLPILIFGIDEIREAAKTNVKIQNIVYTYKEI